MATSRFNGVLVFLACSVLLGAGAISCTAQQATPNYPTKPVELIVAYGTGGAADIAGRLAATYMSKKWGQPVNVVNLPGASGITGTKRVMDSAPDGYTLLVDSHGTTSLGAVATIDLPYKWDNRSMIGRVTIDPVFYAVRADGPWKSLKEVMDYAKSKPGTLKWAAAGVSGISNFAMALLFQEAGVNLADTNQAIFDSGAASANAAAGGHVDIAAQQLSEVTGLAQAGKVRLLAVVLPERIKQFPDVPTLKEAGYNYEIVGWQGISGPPKLPSYVVQKWVDGLKEAARDPQFIEDAAKVNKIVSVVGPEELDKLMHDEYNRYLPIAEKMGIRK